MALFLNPSVSGPILKASVAEECPMRKVMAAFIASLIGLTALSVANTAVACGDSGYYQGK
jgi:hypothetical protein